MIERPRGGERAVLVSIKITRHAEPAELSEFAELATAAGVITVATVVGTREFPDSGFFVGSGKVEEIKALVQAQGIEVVLFNHELTPAQERNLEREFQCRVLDRTGVILDIFAQRARSFEGQLQVELAQLEHLATRLVRGWTHLERQKGGIGLRGPGETQLETDRRLLAERIKVLKAKLEKVSQQRHLGRKARQRAQLPVVSLVGYTNVGKSTLFNRLTHANVFVANQLFATLDPTLRRVILPDKTLLVLADTVGFIQQLPHKLVAAFRATLEETCQASLLLHVVDAGDLERQLRIEQVNRVLTEIGATEVPQLIVYNKIDKLADATPHVEYDAQGHVDKIWLSAVTGAGIDLLYHTLAEKINKDRIRCWVRVPVQAGDLRARLFAEAQVLHEQYADNGDSFLEIQLSAQYFNHLLESEPRLEKLASLPQAS